MITVKNISKYFGSTQALKGVSFEIKKKKTLKITIVTIRMM